MNEKHEKHQCLHCGALVVLDAENATAYHAKPTCDGFRKAMEADGGRRAGDAVGIVTKRS